jgi:hypothetical protein
MPTPINGPLHLGTVPASSVLYVPFHTFGGSNESVIVSDFVLADVAVYKNGSITQRSSTAGYALLDTDGINFDGLAGIHGFSIDLADNTDAGFYSVGGFYWVVVGPLTLATQTVHFVAATFRIGPAENVTGYQPVDTAYGAGKAAIGTFTVTTGSSTTSVVCSATSPTSGVNDQFNGRILIFDNATTTTNLRGCATSVSDYVTATKTFTVTALPATPASGDTGSIF